jgi:hypothetical protein
MLMEIMRLLLLGILIYKILNFVVFYVRVVLTLTTEIELKIAC